MLTHKGTRELQTERLTLRRFTAEEAPIMYRNWASDDEVTKFLTWPSHASVQVSEMILADWLENYERDDYYQWAIVFEGEPIGSIAVVSQNDRIEKALLEFLRPEFINRVDEVIVFNSLTEDDFCSIVKIMLGDLSAVLSEKGIGLSYSDAAAKLIASESFSSKYGARNMRRYIQKNIEDTIAEAIVSDIDGMISKVDISVQDGRLQVTVK